VQLALVTQDFPPARGGIQTWAFELALRLAERCTAFVVVAPAASGAAEADRACNFRVIRTGSPNTLIAAAAPVLAELAAEGFRHTLHAQWSTAPAALALRAAGKLERVAVAVMGRELLLTPWRGLPVAQRGYDLVRRQCLQRADRLISCSDFTADIAKGLGASASRIHVAYAGTDPARFAPRDAAALRARLGLGERRLLVSIARLVPRKGLDTVLRALPEVAAAIPDVRYVVVGDGPDRERLSALAAELGVAERVNFVGAVPGSELPLWYALGDVFVMPSRSDPPDVEGFGIVFLEAAAAERPVVAARAGGVPNAVAHGISGLLVGPDDPAELGRALIELLSDPARRAEFGRRGRERVLAEFTWDHVTARVLHALGA
jgi:phosphatidyl-myo-inositol dimannoside synthase